MKKIFSTLAIAIAFSQNFALAQTVILSEQLQSFSILSGASINSPMSISAFGNIGAMGTISDVISTSDSIFTSNDIKVTESLLDLENTITQLNSLPATTITQLGGQTLSAGVYQINGDISLSDTLALSGDSTSTYVFRVSGNFSVTDGGMLFFRNVNPQNIFWVVDNDVIIHRGVRFYGMVLCNGNISVVGNFGGLLSMLSLNGSIDLMYTGKLPSFFPCAANRFNFTVNPPNPSILSTCPTFLVSNLINGSGQDIGRSVSSDPNGNSYATGTYGFNSSVAYPAVTLGTITLQSKHLSDIYVAKYNSCGVIQWAAGVGGSSGDDIVNSIATDINGNSYIIGSSGSSTLFFYDAAGNTIISLNNIGKRIFVAKINALGIWQWAVNVSQTGNPFLSSSDGLGIDVDNSGNVYVTGLIDANTYTFGSTTLTGSGWTDVFIAKLNASSGVWTWAKKAGGTGADSGYSVAVDSQNNILVTGYFGGVAGANPGVSANFGTINLASQGNGDIFVTKLSALGNFLWAVRGGCTAPPTGAGGWGDFGYDIQSGISTNGYLTGRSPGPATFGSFSVTGLNNAFVAKIDGNGNWMWVSQTVTSNSSPNKAISYSIDIDADENSYITGQVIGTANFGSTTLTTGIPFASLDKNGVWLWALSGSSGSTYLPSASEINTIPGTTSAIVATGAFWDNLTLGSNTYNISYQDESAFVTSICLANFNVTITPNGPISFCEGTGNLTLNTTVTGGNQAYTYLWSTGATTPSITVTTAGTYSITVTDACGKVVTSQIIVTTFPTPIANAGADVTNCLGQPCPILSGSGGGTYAWSPTTGLSNPNISNPEACPTTTTTYTLTVTSSSGCTATDDVIVTANTPPNITITSSTPTFCVGQSTTLTASGAATYAWSPTTGLSSTTDPTVTANPTTTTTYTVIGTDASGCSTTSSVTVTVNSLPNIDVTPKTPTICSGETLTLTASGANTYVWNPGNFSGNPYIVSPTTTTIYTVNGTDANGCSSTYSVPVTVDNNCLCTAPTTIPVTGANSSSYGSGFSNTTIAINGNFTINSNFSITNTTLLMGPNTKIIVQSGRTLTIIKSSLYSCYRDMWDGIEIQPKGRLIVLNNTLIEDAKIAVLSDNNGGIAYFYIEKTTFNRNYIGVKVENYNSSTPHTGTIRSSTFDSRNSTTSTVNTPLLDVPYDTQPAEIGVYLYVVNNVQVGVTTNPAAKNNFRYLKTGIFGVAADYKVYNNDFRNNVPKGWAIVNIKSSRMVAGGNLANQPNNFQSLSNGISHTSSSDLEVANNTFTNINVPIFSSTPSIAVYTSMCDYATVILNNNLLTGLKIGFKHFKNSKATYKVTNNSFKTFFSEAITCVENTFGTVDINLNTFNDNPTSPYFGNTAVYVANVSVSLLSSPTVTINDNNISRINKGVHAVQILGLMIKNNNVTFNSTIVPTLIDFYFGIRTQNCAKEDILLNTIDRIGANPMANEVNALYGISSEADNSPGVTENTVKKMANGFRFRYSPGSAGFRCNTMTNNWFGLTLESANIGDQGYAPSIYQPDGGTTDNSWSDPLLIGSPTAVKGAGTIYSPAFYTRDAGYPFTPTHISPLWTIQTFGGLPIPLPGSYLTNAPQNCQTICYDPSTCKIPRLAKIARNENPFDQVLGNERFMMQEAVLRGVISDSLVIDTTVQDGRDLQTYIDTLALTNVGKLLEVNTLLSRGDTLLAEALNLSISPKECADAYHKIVNEIYFRTWAKNVFEFSPTDSTVLYDIAVQDPLVCGTAIYNARVMMNIDINDYIVDEKAGNRLMNTETSTTGKVMGKLYPNPSQNTVNYEINLAAEQMGLLIFYDLMGKEVLANQLIGGDNKLTLDVSKFQNGLYLYKVFINGKPQETGKFIIQH